MTFLAQKGQEMIVKTPSDHFLNGLETTFELLLWKTQNIWVKSTGKDT